MRSLVALLAALTLAPCVPCQKSGKTDVEVLETRARRGNGEILVDLRMRVSGEKSLRGLVVYFDLMSAENGTVTSQKAVLDDQKIDPGDERSCHSVTTDPVRAVRYKIRAFDIVEKELRVANPGPFPIE